jgi:hypothetical protein
MKPTNKAEQLEAMLIKVLGKNRRMTIALGECMGCDVTGVRRESFTSEVSAREYTISGLCQICQNDVCGDQNDKP